MGSSGAKYNNASTIKRLTKPYVYITLGMFIKPYDTKRLVNNINICNCFDAEKLCTNSNFYTILPCIYPKQLSDMMSCVQ